jgi:dTMP kinase
VILLEADEAALSGRVAARGEVADAIEGRSAEYHRAVTAAFRALAEADPAGFARIDAIGSPDDVQDRILLAIADLMP